MFWLLVIASIAAAVYAVRRRLWRWMLVSAVLYAPFAWYLSATPNFWWAMFILPFHFIAAYTLWRGQRTIAGLFMTPSLILSLWIALLVIFQPVP